MASINLKIHFSPTQLLLLTIFAQTVILGFAWGFTGALVFGTVLVLPDHIVHLIVEYPTVLTLIVTLISTALSIITSMLFTYAVKEALRHHLALSGPITLFKLRAAIALTGPTKAWRWKYLKLSVLTLAVYAVITFLSSSWSTLLLPTIVRWPVPMSGTELDLGSIAFANQLSVDLNTPQGNGVQAPAFETINVLTLLSGIAAVNVEGGMQTSSIFSFNGVSYNRSTGGILPAIEEYSGASNLPSGVGLAFSGGRVPVNSIFDWERHWGEAGTHGIAKNYTVTQQGVTADVTCQPMNHSKNSFSTFSTPTQGPLNNSFLTWETVANCSGNVNSLPYFTAGNASGQMDPASTGFLPVVVCPSPQSTSFNAYNFGVFMSGLYKYDFLPTIVCEVVPYLTTVNVTYNGGIIFVERVATSSGLTESPTFPLSQYIATVMAYQAGTNQALTKNTIGDFLTAYDNGDVSDMYRELVTVSAPLASTWLITLQEDYWRGITEFASTSDMTRSTSGMMYITTYGWRSHSRTFIYLPCATMLAALYSITQERYSPSDRSFDFFDPLYLITAASGGGLEGQLRELDISQTDKIEDLIVQFGDVFNKEGKRNGKKLVSG
ncbi:uncharacterized protein EDB91DRAFT_1170737 [Suillus paluster]|uniref:uncharacterized protein n=1 Tax=Suillus paluster TaxID=48578 RepID=UPI001B880755|nr:uncharacterized protein EDB91DRAFT_1170737 [Suillus paluster]KAG1724509.1 hypothetical protein EDB91DRAFT_1170737 [Suillus paluster]